MTSDLQRFCQLTTEAVTTIKADNSMSAPGGDLPAEDYRGVSNSDHSADYQGTESVALIRL